MTDDIIARPTSWRTVLLVCGKCTRKLDGGFGEKGREKLKSVLRSRLRETGRRREIRVIETRCMGLCPKNAVTAMNASRPGRIFTIGKDTDAAVAAERLLEGDSREQG